MGVASVLVLGFGAVLAWQAMSAHQALDRVQSVHEATDHFLEAKALLARERGWGAAALGGADPEAVRAELDRLQPRVEERINSALSVTRTVEERIASSELIEASRNRTEELWRDHQEFRGRLRPAMDTGDPGLDHEEWIAAYSGLIEALGELRRQLLLAVDAPREIANLAIGVQDRTVQMSEHMGRNRAIMAYYAGAGLPIPPPFLERLHANRRTTEQAFHQLAALVAARPEWTAELGGRVTELDERLTTFRVQVAQPMLQAAETGNYPRDAVAWFEAATATIDPVLSLSGFTFELINDQVHEQAQRRWLAFVLYGLVALGAGILAALSLLRVHRDAADLHVQKELAETTLHSIGDAVITTDARGRITYLNPVAEELTGWRSSEAQGHPSSAVLRLRNTRHASLVDPVAACLERGHAVGLTSGHVLARPDGREISIEDSCAPIHNEDGSIAGTVLVFYDTENTQHQNHLLAYHASRDALTGLINRREFERRLEELVERPKEAGEQHALAYMDLDQFKVVNDTAGHAAGDQLLRQLSFFLRERVRGSDVLARLGGDEFALLFYHCPLERAATVCNGLLQAIDSFRFPWAAREFDVGASVGLVPITEETSSAVAALSDSDNACFIAKEKGRNRIHIHSPDDEEVARRRSQMEWTTQIREALHEERLIPYVQSIQSLTPGLPNHEEVLVRLLDTNGELIPPMAFIPAAERFGYMPEIDRTVIRSTCALLAQAPYRNRATVFNVNLSGASLSDHELAGFIVAETGRHGVPPERLCFEITETAAINNLDTATALMQELKAHGFTFALDDFGSGLSSFGYLRRLPVDSVKIDGTFVQTVVRDPVNQAMVQSIIRISRIMGLTVTAEFVEDQETLELLRNMGIDHAQGFGVGYPRPLTEEDAKELLKTSECELTSHTSSY